MYLQQVLSALSSAYGQLRAETLVDAIRAIREARRVRVFGVAVSGVIAQEAAMRFMRLGLEAQSYADSHFRRISAGLMGPEDTAICISHCRQTQPGRVGRSDGFWLKCRLRTLWLGQIQA